MEGFVAGWRRPQSWSVTLRVHEKSQAKKFINLDDYTEAITA
jgi:hypothetical protein